MFNILKNLIGSFWYFCKRNTYNVGVLGRICIPYIMFSVGLREGTNRTLTVYRLIGIILLCVIVSILLHVLVEYANRNNIGSSVPVYVKRFTNNVGDGEIQIKEEDLQEVILYLHEVEEYLQRTGKVRWQEEEN